jgi:chorismate dehydratase
MTKTARPRVGHIRFLNCLPLYYGLIHHGAASEMKLAKGTPAELNRWLIEGELDISPISAIEYARNASQLLLLPDLSVGSDGEVKSILLASKVPIEKLDGRSIALADTSRTSQLLLKMILKDKYGVEPAYFEQPPDLRAMLDRAEAALLIGDPALRALWKPDNDLHLYDLGSEWKSYTGRRMVYAVWAVRRDYYESWPERVAAVYRYFLDSMEYSVLHLDRIAAEAAPETGLEAPFLANYFRTLRFDLHSGYKRDFLVFLSKAKDLGQLDEVPELSFIEDGRPAANRATSDPVTTG